MSKRIMLSDKNILLFSNEPWGDMWFSKHHYALSLSRNNHVYFINPTGPWSWKNLFQTKPVVKEVQPGLFSVYYRNFFPKTGSVGFLRKINERLIARQLLQLTHKRERIFYSFDPIRFSEPQLFQPCCSIYYCVDAHEHIIPERRLALNCDLILVVNERLKRKFTGISVPVRLLSHGIPENPYSLEQRLHAEEKKQVLYMGSVDYRFDFRMLHTIASQHPNHRFLIFGLVNKAKFKDDDNQRFAACEALPNVTFRGIVPFRELAPYILESAICLGIFKADRENDALNSLKILQYLSYGKTVVTSYFDTYNQAPANLLYMAAPGDYPAVFSSRIATQSTAEHRQMRIAHAEQFSYQRLIGQIEQFINQQATEA